MTYLGEVLHVKRLSPHESGRARRTQYPVCPGIELSGHRPQVESQSVDDQPGTGAESNGLLLPGGHGPAQGRATRLPQAPVAGRGQPIAPPCIGPVAQAMVAGTDQRPSATEVSERVESSSVVVKIPKEVRGMQKEKAAQAAFPVRSRRPCRDGGCRRLLARYRAARAC